MRLVQHPPARRPHRVPLILAAILAASLASGCGAPSVPETPRTAVQVPVRAEGLAFEPAEVTAPKGVPLRLVLDNRDQGIPHNLRAASSEIEIGKTEVVIGPGRAEVVLKPLAPGRYQLSCEVHPNMTAVLVITP